jgi:hypothetical protein
MDTNSYQTSSKSKPAVLFVRANPNPHESLCTFLCYRAMSAADPDTPEKSDLLQLQRAMTRIAFE